jgi:hypothetical protein
MRVNVDPAWKDGEPGRIDLAPAAANNDAHFSDDSVVDGDVTHERWRTSSVDNVSASNHHVMHLASL